MKSIVNSKHFYAVMAILLLIVGFQLLLRPTTTPLFVFWLLGLMLIFEGFMYALNFFLMMMKQKRLENLIERNKEYLQKELEMQNQLVDDRSEDMNVVMEVSVKGNAVEDFGLGKGIIAMQRVKISKDQIDNMEHDQITHHLEEELERLRDTVVKSSYVILTNGSQTN